MYDVNMAEENFTAKARRRKEKNHQYNLLAPSRLSGENKPYFSIELKNRK
jgi:hypothetical protein